MAEVLTTVYGEPMEPPPMPGEWPTRLLGLFPMQGQWTEDQYWDLPESNWFVELSKGRLVMPDMPGTRHQKVAGMLFRLLCRHVEDNGHGDVATAPLPARLWPGKVREPDVMVMLKEHGDRIEEKRWGVPDLVAEVISPRTEESSGTEKTDRVEKKWEYAQAGVQEYWIVHPTERTIEVYGLKGEEYELLGSHGTGETARSRLLRGFEVAVDEVMPEG